MGRRATTYEEQIEILKGRGLEIVDEEKAREVLADVGYYRLGFYAHHFQLTKDEFNRGVKFDDVVGLYQFDTSLRIILQGALMRIELNFRTKFDLSCLEQV